MNHPDSKKCTKYGQVKPLEMFHRSQKVKQDGRASSCKQCCKDHHDRKFTDDPEKFREISRRSAAKRYQEDPKKFREKRKACYRQAPEKEREATRTRLNAARTQDPSKFAEIARLESAERRSRDLEGYRKYQREWCSKKRASIILNSLSKLTNLQPPHEPNDSDT